MTIKLEGDALQLLDDFIKYSICNSSDVADALQYDHDGFRKRLHALISAFDKR